MFEEKSQNQKEKSILEEQYQKLLQEMLHQIEFKNRVCSLSYEEEVEYQKMESKITAMKEELSVFTKHPILNWRKIKRRKAESLAKENKKKYDIEKEGKVNTQEQKIVFIEKKLSIIKEKIAVNLYKK